MKRQGIAQKAVAAGLGLAMALGTIAPSVALADNGGQTNLYVESQQSDTTTHEGAEDENIKVVLPVAISYVADTEGNLTGPSDNSVKIKNNTQLGSVHVSKIRVTPETDVTVVGTANDADQNDEVYLHMKPGSGTDVALSSFLTEAAPKRGDWDIAQQGELAINSLTGKIGGFGELDPSTKEKLATVHWTVAAGTAQQAAFNADQLLIHRVYPNGIISDYTTSKSNPLSSLGEGYTWKLSDGTVVTNSRDVVEAVDASATEATVYAYSNS
ncbi:MAG: hypothetical protein IKG69_04410 [Atopobiaceae bacterium]|nr:hypothetical protein [Atopobiaceae bacterium]